MRQLFKTRYTKSDPRIKSWYGVGPEGSSEVIVGFPDSMDSPFRGRDLTEMIVFFEDNLDEKLLFLSYPKGSSPKYAFDGLSSDIFKYEEVVL